MFDFHFGPQFARCDGHSRRDFLRVGGLTALGLSLPQLLRAEQPAASASRAKARAKSVVLIYLSGGLSHIDSFDPKPDAPEEVRGQLKPIDTSVSGVRVSELLPMTAKAMNHVALVRSVTHNIDHHETATNWMLSGRFGSAFGDYPAMGAVVAHDFGFSGALPPYVVVPKHPGFGYDLGKSAYLGGRYEAFKTGDPGAADFQVPDIVSAEPLDAKRAGRRQALLEAVDGLARKVEGNDQLATYDELHRRAAAITLSGEARSAFAVNQEPERLRDRYGRTTFGQSCLLARRLVERGVRFVTITSGGWDHHQDIWKALGTMLAEFDRGYSALVEDADARGLLSETLIVVMGEFGRTPRVNGAAGRDHWGAASSVVFAGAGTGRGIVVGATDKQGAYVAKRPVGPADVAWSVYEALGIDAHKQLLAPDGRPIDILDTGAAIRELVA